MQRTTMGFFNVRLSIFNTLSIVFVGFIWGFPQSIGYQVIVLTSDSACKIIPYLTRIMSQMSSWLLVMASFDRMLMLLSYKSKNNVRDPQEIKDTKKHSLRIKVLFLLICLVNIPNLFFSLNTQIIFDTITNKTLPKVTLCTSTPTVILLRDIVTRFSYGLLPFILQIAISAILIYRLRKLDGLMHTVSINRERKYTFTIIVFNLIFIMADVFNTVCIIFINIYGYNEATYISKNSKEAAISSFAYLCSIYFTIFCIGDLLFIINLVTNKRFRKEALRIFIFLSI